MITVILETIDFDEIQGIEKQVFFVDNREDEYADEGLGTKKFYNYSAAKSYADWLNRKFNTDDIVVY